MVIIPQSTDVPDIGIIMSKDCSFDSHISSLSRKCKNLAGWILRSIVSRDKLTMLTLFKSLVISRLDYASQLWSPHKISQVQGHLSFSFFELKTFLKTFFYNFTVFTRLFGRMNVHPNAQA